jgi:hypothetical protein
MILIASHGDTLFEGLGDALRPEWGWKSTGGQAVVLTGTALDSLNLRRWQRDLRLGRMAIFPGGVTGVLPSFFTQYSVRLPASIVYVGSCRSSANASLSSALLGWRGRVPQLQQPRQVGFAGEMAPRSSQALQGQTLDSVRRACGRRRRAGHVHARRRRRDGPHDRTDVNRSFGQAASSRASPLR